MNGGAVASGGAEGGAGGVSFDEAGMDIVVEPMQGSPRIEDEEGGVEGGGDKPGPTSMPMGLHDSHTSRPQPGVGGVVRVDVGSGGGSLDASLSPHTAEGIEGIEVLDGEPLSPNVPGSWAASSLPPLPPLNTTWGGAVEQEEVGGGGLVMRKLWDDEDNDDRSEGSNKEDKEDRGPGSPTLPPLPSSITQGQQGAPQAYQGQSDRQYDEEDMDVEVIEIGEQEEEEAEQAETRQAAARESAGARARALGLGSDEEDDEGMREALAASKELLSPGELGRMARREAQAAQAFAQSHIHKLSPKVRRRVQQEALEAQEALSTLTKCLTGVAVGEDDYVVPGPTEQVQLVGQVGWEEFCNALDSGLDEEGASREIDRANLVKASVREQLYLKARTLLQDKQWQPLKCDAHGVEKLDVDEPALWHRLGYDASLHGPLPSTLTSLLVDKRRQACRVMLLPRNPVTKELLDLGQAITQLIPASLRELHVELSKCGHTMPELNHSTATASGGSSASSTPRGGVREGPSAVSIDQLLASNTKARRTSKTIDPQQSYWLPAAAGVLDSSVLQALRHHIHRGLAQPQGPWMGTGRAKDLDKATEQAVTHATRALHKLLYAVSTREGEERVDLSGVSFPLDLPTARALIQQMLGLRNGLMSLARDGLAYYDRSKQLTVDEYTAWTELTGLLVNPAPPSLEGGAASPPVRVRPLVLHDPIRSRLRRFLAQTGDGGGDGRVSLLAVDQDLHKALPSLPKPPQPPKGPLSALVKPEKKRDHKCKYANDLQALLDAIPQPTKTTALASTTAILEEFLAHEARLDGEELEESGSEGGESGDSSFKASAVDESEDDLDEDLSSSSSSSSGEEEVEEVVGTTICHKKKRHRDRESGDKKPRAKPTGAKKPKAPSGKGKAKDTGKPAKLPRRQSAPSALPSSLLSAGGVKKPSASGGPSSGARPTPTSTSTSTGATSPKRVNIKQRLQQHEQESDVDSDDSLEFHPQPSSAAKRKKDASGSAKRGSGSGSSKRPRDPPPSTVKPSASVAPAPLPQPKRRKSDTSPVPSGEAVNGGKKRALPSSSFHRAVPPPVDIVPPKMKEGPVMPGDTLIDLGRLNHSPSGTRPVLRNLPVVEDAMLALQYGNVSKLEVQAIMEREGKGARDGADMGQDLYRHWGSWLNTQPHVDLQGDTTLDLLRRWPRALLRVMVQPKLTLNTPAEVSGNLGKAAIQSRVKEVLTTLRDTHHDTIDTIWGLFLRFLSEKKHWRPSGHLPTPRPPPRVLPPAPAPAPRPSLPPLPPPPAFPSRPSSSRPAPAPAPPSSSGPKFGYVFNPTMRTQLEVFLSSSSPHRMAPESAASERKKMERAMKELAGQVQHISSHKAKDEARQERRALVQVMSEPGMATASRLTSLSTALEKLINRVKREGGIQRVAEGTFHYLKRLQAALKGLAKHMTEGPSPQPLPHQGPASASFTIPLTRPREPIPLRPLPPPPAASSHAPIALRQQEKQEEEEEEDGWGPELELSAPLEDSPVADTLPSPAAFSDNEEVAVLWEGALWVHFVGFVRAWARQMKLQWESGQDEAIAVCAHEWLRQQLARTHPHPSKMKDGHQLHGVLQRAGLRLAESQPLHARLLLRYGLSRLASEHHAD